MESSFLNRLKNQLKYWSSGSAVNEGPAVIPLDAESPSLFFDDNPVERYYRHRVKTQLPVFSRFALQSRSLFIRDVFARVASGGRQDLGDLTAFLESLEAPWAGALAPFEFESYYDPEILLALADLIANTAGDDLDTHSALQIYDFVFAFQGVNAFKDHNKLQYVEALGEAGRYDDLNVLLDDFSIGELAPLQPEFLNVQKINSTSSSDTAWVVAMNKIYQALDMSLIRLSDDDTLPLFDRLTSTTREHIHGPKVSVIMPTFSPGNGIRTAIRSLLDQSWQNMEIIVVDDASPVQYHELLFGLETLDPRIRVVRQLENAGAYVARNAGLELATGEYITTHDDDDWSHPDKLATQASLLERDPNVLATTSAHIRTTEDMSFRRVNMHARYMHMNYSSLMFKRSVVDEIGPWDRVNRGGDSEFITRLIESFGSKRVVNLDNKPLSFSRVWAGSLTSGEMFRGYFAYSRLLYRWSFRQWQWDVAREGKKPIRDVTEPRPYAVPTTFEPGDRNKDLGNFDVIYVTDYFRQSKFVDFVMDDIDSLQRRGYRVGYMHLQSPQTNSPAGFPAELFTLQQQGLITQISEHDIATTKLLVVYDASLGMFSDELKSSIVSNRSILVHHELPTLSGIDDRTPVLMKQALQLLDAAFKTRFEVVGATLDDQKRVSNSVPDDRVLSNSFIWNTHLRQTPGSIAAPQTTPTVGFHSYGNVYRWPSNKEIFSDLYISSLYRTRFYGNFADAQEKFGDDLFDQVEATYVDLLDESEFLEGIDFWVYHPHYRLEDQIWKPVLSAMQAGKVVILPHRLKSVYGSAALYADQYALNQVVLRLSNDAEAYTSQARLGQEFVAAYYTRASFIKRVRALIGSTEDAL